MSRVGKADTGICVALKSSHGPSAPWPGAPKYGAKKRPGHFGRDDSVGKCRKTKRTQDPPATTADGAPGESQDALVEGLRGCSSHRLRMTTVVETRFGWGWLNC